jgi:hypothetical protein
MDKDTAEALARWAMTRVNPYLLPPDQQGWRGISLPGYRKRKVFTALHNDQVLVTVMIQVPGETGARHSHETGELSIHYESLMRPVITWYPPNEIHGGIPYNEGRPLAPAIGEEMVQLLEHDAPSEASTPEVARLTRQVQELQDQVRQLIQERAELLRPAPEPRILVDVLFPPFKTTIHDPAYPEPRTIVGQWYD